MRRRVPIAFFSMVMGLGGLATVWRQASLAWGVPRWIGLLFWAAAVVLWLVVALGYVVTARRYPHHARGELLNHGSGVFAALAFMSLTLLTIPVFTFAPTAARLVWAVAAAGQFVLGAWLVNRWITEPVDPSLISGGWLLPPVGGNLLAAMGAGAAGLTVWAWMFLGAGVLSWVFVNGLIFTRQVSHTERLTELQAPTAFIQVAPPVLVINALLPTLTPTVNGWVLGLWGFSLFILATILVSFDRMLRIPFGPHWWAMTFPTAALALASVKISEYSDELVASIVAPVLLGLATLLILTIATRTVMLARAGMLLPRVAAPPPVPDEPNQNSEQDSASRW